MPGVYIWALQNYANNSNYYVEGFPENPSAPFTKNGRRDTNPHLRPYNGPPEPGTATEPGSRLSILYPLSLLRPPHMTTNTFPLLPPPQPASFGPPFSPALLPWVAAQWLLDPAGGTSTASPSSSGANAWERPQALRSRWRGHLHMNRHPISLL